MAFRCILLMLFLKVYTGFSQNKDFLIHDNYKRSYITYLPKTYSIDKQHPLILVLHGGGGTATQIMQSTKGYFNVLADKNGFIVVYPNGVKKSWNDNPKRDTNSFSRKKNIDDVSFIKNLIELLELKYSINPKAVFACGISNGGLMSQTLAMALPDKIKAVGMVASNFGSIQIEESKNVQPFSILFIHGTADPIFPYQEVDIQVFNKSRGHVLGIDKSITYMCNLNGNEKLPIKLSIKNKALNDNCTSEHCIFPNPKNPYLKIELIKVTNGGHTWPGAKEQRFISKVVGNTTQDFNACDKLWAFFKSIID
ncbi:alpha/beta hydrolase family esterase [Aestuariivivens marinum]|uniref:alpha/beta hydrolase family esterase n=1 Tax=Aestuariivivens marinum TaxID=2913555 RepID=UPI001F568899|nr:PHB depolymerase family esterase [Aestuariivivens marinum]